MDTLLVNGYVRQIEKLLKRYQIIPLDIYKICFDLSRLTGYRWKINIHELNDHKSVIKVEDTERYNYFKWSLDEAGIAFAKDIQLPKSIKSKLSHSIKCNNVIFRCGGSNNHHQTSNYCAGLIIDSHKFHKPNNDINIITAHNPELPKLKTEMSVCALFSKFNQGIIYYTQ